jgi:hypothetical protein
MHTLRLLVSSFLLGLISIGSANAAPLQFNISTTVTDVQGSYIGGVVIGDTITGTFVVDDDMANASPGSDPGPGANPGHEYTSFWEFNGSPYGVNLLDVDQGGSFSSSAQAIVVNDGLAITADDTGGMIPDGTYDWIEILGATTSDYCPPATDCVANPNEILSADGDEWTLAIFASDDLWFTGGDIPQNLPGSYTAFLIGFEYDTEGNEIGIVVAPADTFAITAVPIPAAVWLFGSALAGLGWMRRK